MSIYDINWPFVYQVSMRQEYLSQQVINRFFYHVFDNVALGLEDVAVAFFNWWNAYSPAIQSQDCLYKTVHVLEMFDDKQQFEYDVTGGNGSQGVSELPAFFALRFKLFPADTRIKKGRKSLAGVIEEMVDGNNIAAAYVQPCTNWASSFVSGLTSGAHVLEPVLLSPANLRHPTNLQAKVLECIVGGFSTQNSRKAGRGA